MVSVPSGTHAAATEPAMTSTTTAPAPASCTATWATDCSCSECCYERRRAPKRLTAEQLRERLWLARERRA